MYTDPPLPLSPSNNVVKNKQLPGLGKVYTAHNIQHCEGGRGKGEEVNFIVIALSLQRLLTSIVAKSGLKSGKLETFLSKKYVFSIISVNFSQTNKKENWADWGTFYSHFFRQRFVTPWVFSTLLSVSCRKFDPTPLSCRLNRARLHVIQISAIKFGHSTSWFPRNLFLITKFVNVSFVNVPLKVIKHNKMI